MVQRRKNKSSSRKLTERDIKVSESVLEMLDNIEQDSKYDDDYSLGYQAGLKKAIRILKKHYSIKKTFQLR